MRDWRLNRLGDVCSIDKQQASHSGLPYVGLEDIESNTAKFIGDLNEKEVKSSTFKFSPDHILYGRLRPYLNKVTAPNFIGHCSTEIFPIKPSQNILKEFLLYWFLSEDIVRKIDETCTGARMPRANMDRVMEFKILVPPLPEQRRIVAILDEAFAGLETMRINAEKNGLNSNDLFFSNLNRLIIDDNVTCKEHSMSNICEIISSLIDPREQNYRDMLHIGAGNMVAKTGDLIELKTAREENLISGKFLFDETMVLYSKIRPYLMKVCRPDFKGLCSADVYPLVPNSDLIDKNYLFYLLLTNHFTEFAIRGSDRAGMPKVNRTHLFSYKVRIPDLSKQLEIVNKLDKISLLISEIKDIYENKIIAIDALKQSILHRAFTGELTSSDIAA